MSINYFGVVVRLCHLKSSASCLTFKVWDLAFVWGPPLALSYLFFCLCSRIISGGRLCSAGHGTGCGCVHGKCLHPGSDSDPGLCSRIAKQAAFSSTVHCWKVTGTDRPQLAGVLPHSRLWCLLGALGWAWLLWRPCRWEQSSLPCAWTSLVLTTLYRDLCSLLVR